MLGEQTGIFLKSLYPAGLLADISYMYFLCCCQKRDVCKMVSLIMFQPHSQGIQL